MPSILKLLVYSSGSQKAIINKLTVVGDANSITLRSLINQKVKEKKPDLLFNADHHIMKVESSTGTDAIELLDHPVLFLLQNIDPKEILVTINTYASKGSKLTQEPTEVSPINSGGKDVNGKVEAQPTGIVENESALIDDQKEEEASAPASELEASDANMDDVRSNAENSGAEASEVTMEDTLTGADTAPVEEPLSSSSTAENTEWKCTKCTMLNPLRRKTCQICRAKRNNSKKRRTR